jgi:uncharacterized protein DUF6448
MPIPSWRGALVFLAVLLLVPSRALSHCDGMDGPVVKAAQKALATGNLNLVLIWVQKGDEAELRAAFEQTMSVRKLSGEAKALADRYFFETMVRLHRTGEGAPYTGLKPAGRDLGPAIPAADRALEEGSAGPLAKLLVDAVQSGANKQFQATLAKKKFDPNDVDAGRAYVKAYVEFVHYVERIYESTRNPAHGHYAENAEAAPATEEP